MTFTVRPGALMQGVSFGFGQRTLRPYFGADMYWLGVSLKDESTDYYENHYSAGESYGSRQTTRETLNAHGFLLIPHFGAKLYFKQGAGDTPVNVYGRGGMFFSIPSVNMKGERVEEEWLYENGAQTDHDQRKEDLKLSDSDRKLANDILSFWGFDFALGAEYCFSPKFSVGGEYGLRFLLNSIVWKDKSESSWGDENYGGSDGSSWKEELDATFRMTYSAINLTYRF
jgi:hypothetical protein